MNYMHEHHAVAELGFKNYLKLKYFLRINVNPIYIISTYKDKIGVKKHLDFNLG